MKIALITIHNVNSYGAVLQAFATKEILSRYGEVQTINYFNPHLPGQLDLIRFKFSIQGTKMALHDILQFKDRYNVVRKFKKFINSNMNLSKLFTQYEIQHGAVNSNFDVYVCGSDQIWNPGIVSRNGELDSIYFLSFVNEKAKKISYASSAGSYRFKSPKNQEIVRSLLKDFMTISVRESDTQERLSQLLGREIFHVLDPTLLLSEEEWLDVLGIDKDCKNKKDNYILVYSLDRAPLLRKITEFITKRLEYKVVTVDQGLTSFLNSGVQIRNAGPIEFIELFANAGFVITDSFHGVCFSITLKKPFVSMRLAPKANRIESLLNLLGLKDRLINDEKDMYQLSTAIDYESVENKLKNEREKSLQFLSSGILS